MMMLAKKWGFYWTDIDLAVKGVWHMSERKLGSMKY